MKIVQACFGFRVSGGNIEFVRVWGLLLREIVSVSIMGIVHGYVGFPVSDSRSVGGGGGVCDVGAGLGLKVWV